MTFASTMNRFTYVFNCALGHDLTGQMSLPQKRTNNETNSKGVNKILKSNKMVMFLNLTVLAIS